MATIRTIVVRPLPQLENRFLRAQPRMPVSSTEARCAGVRRLACSVMLSAPQGDAFVVPVHERRDRQADREVGGHDDQDVLDRLARLVDRDVHRGDEVGIADGDGQRAVLGDVEILAGHRRHDHAQRLWQQHQTHRPGRATGRAPLRPRSGPCARRGCPNARSRRRRPRCRARAPTSRAVNSGWMTVPPTKLKPLSSGQLI